MKTAKEIIKFIIVILALVWLCSCNGNEQIVRQIHSCNDSIGVTKAAGFMVKMKIDSLRREYGTQYPPGYGNLLMEKIRLEAKEVGLRYKIDSLKIELEQ